MVVVKIAVRDLNERDLGWAESLFDERLGGRMQARMEELLDVLKFSGLAAEVDGEASGVLLSSTLGS